MCHTEHKALIYIFFSWGKREGERERVSDYCHGALIPDGRFWTSVSWALSNLCCYGGGGGGKRHLIKTEERGGNQQSMKRVPNWEKWLQPFSKGRERRRIYWGSEFQSLVCLLRVSHLAPSASETRTKRTRGALGAIMTI